MRCAGAAGRHLFLVGDLSSQRNIKENRHKWCVGCVFFVFVGEWVSRIVCRWLDEQGVMILPFLCDLSHAFSKSIPAIYFSLCVCVCVLSHSSFCSSLFIISSFSLSLKTPARSRTEQLLERSDQSLHAALYSPRGLKLKFRLDAARCVHHMDVSLFFFFFFLFPSFVYTCCPKSS